MEQEFTRVQDAPVINFVGYQHLFASLAFAIITLAGFCESLHHEDYRTQGENILRQLSEQWTRNESESHRDIKEFLSVYKNKYSLWFHIECSSFTLPTSHSVRETCLLLAKPGLSKNVWCWRNDNWANIFVSPFKCWHGTSTNFSRRKWFGFPKINFQFCVSKGNCITFLAGCTFLLVSENSTPHELFRWSEMEILKPNVETS